MDRYRYTSLLSMDITRWWVHTDTQTPQAKFQRITKAPISLKSIPFVSQRVLSTNNTSNVMTQVFHKNPRAVDTHIPFLQPHLFGCWNVLMNRYSYLGHIHLKLSLKPYRTLTLLDQQTLTLTTQAAPDLSLSKRRGTSRGDLCYPFLVSLLVWDAAAAPV